MHMIRSEPFARQPRCGDGPIDCRSHSLACLVPKPRTHLELEQILGHERRAASTGSARLRVVCHHECGFHHLCQQARRTIPITCAQRARRGCAKGASGRPSPARGLRSRDALHHAGGRGTHKDVGPTTQQKPPSRPRAVTAALAHTPRPRNQSSSLRRAPGTPRQSPPARPPSRSP